MYFAIWLLDSVLPCLMKMYTSSVLEKKLRVIKCTWQNVDGKICLTGRTVNMTMCCLWYTFYISGKIVKMYSHEKLCSRKSVVNIFVIDLYLNISGTAFKYGFCQIPMQLHASVSCHLHLLLVDYSGYVLKWYVKYYNFHNCKKFWLFVSWNRKQKIHLWKFMTTLTLCSPDRKCSDIYLALSWIQILYFNYNIRHTLCLLWLVKNPQKFLSMTKNQWNALN